MIVKRITQVTLTRTTERTPGDHTTYPGTELFRVVYTLTSNLGKVETLRQSHYTEAAARQHVANLVEQRVEGLTVAAVYSEFAT
jgi:hypothetical protein